MKYITAIGMVILTVFVWISVIGQILSGNHTYEQSLAHAKEYEGRGLYLKAVDAYGEAYASAQDKDKYALMMKAIFCYEILKDNENIEKMCLRVIKLYPDEQECYQKLLQYYQSRSNYAMLLSLLESAMKHFPEEEVYREAYEEIEKNYDVISLGYKEMSDWRNGYLLAKTEVELLEDELNEEQKSDKEKKNEKITTNLQTEYRILDYSMGKVAENLYYDNLSMTDEVGSKFIVQDKVRRWKIVNQRGYELENNLNVSFEKIGTFGEGYTWAVIDGKYHLMNGNMAVSKDNFEKIGTVHNGLTAAQKDGKWAIFSATDMKNITGYEFIDMKSNEFQDFYINECFMGAKKEGEYQLFDEKGKALSDTVFENLKPFYGQQPAAAKKGGKWGFINKDGSFYIEPKYEDAKSFSNGYAAVKVKGKWGFINRYNHLIVEPAYKDVKSFGAGGYAPVKNKDGYWDMISMKTLRYS